MSLGFFYCTLGNTITDIKNTRHGLTGLMGRKKHWILRGLLLLHSGEYNNRYESRREKTSFLHMRKQRRRSASR